MKKLKNIFIMLIAITIIETTFAMVNATETTNEGNTEEKVAEEVEIEQDERVVLYSSHLRNIGWEEDFSKSDGAVSGGESRNSVIEAIKIKSQNLPSGAKITYQAHVQDIGWMDWVQDGKTAGTTGRAKKVEALRIKLENAPDYSIKYSSYVDGKWQEWAIDGELSGTTGKNKPVSAIKIIIVPKEIKGKVVIEKPTAPVYENTLNVTGWAMANIENKVLETYIDGIKVESIVTYSQKSTAPEIGYGGIENTSKPIYNINIDVSNLTDGEKNLQVKLLTKEGQELATAEKTIAIERSKIRVKYQAHVENVGWQSEVYSTTENGIAGTTGRNLQVEALKIELLGDLPKGAKITYQAHVQDIGWQNWVEGGKTAGTTGRAKQVEAIRIKLENMDDYSIKYQAHVQDIGWQNWAIDGELAGTVGRNKQVEAIRIVIVPKEIKSKIVIEKAPTNVYEQSFEVSGWAMTNAKETTLEAYIDDEKVDSTIKYSSKSIAPEIGYGGLENTPNPVYNMNISLPDLEDGEKTLKIKMLDKNGQELTMVTKKIILSTEEIRVKYQAHVQNIGWQSAVYSGDNTIAGTTGRNLNMEAIKVQLIGKLPENAKIKFQAHVQDIGWMSWQEDGASAGTTGRAKKIEAIRIKLENMDDYSIEYRAHVADIGWQDWAYDGEYAGTTGQNKGVQALEIRLVRKITATRARMYVDTPFMDGVSVVNVVQRSTTISGWAMTNQSNTSVRIKIDGNVIGNGISRVARQDVLNAIKGYGGDEKNPFPGFTTTVNFRNYSVGYHTIVIDVLSSDGKVLTSMSRTLNVQVDFAFSIGTYGRTGLAVAGDGRGSNLEYYRLGRGNNVAFLTFAVHGWEDNYSFDGSALIKIAEDFKNMLLQNKPQDINENWTIYIFPGINKDGVGYGSSHDGPGRTTLFSAAPGHRGIDINRNWQTSSSYKTYSSARNYNGTGPYQAYEAADLRTLLVNYKTVTGKNVLIDLHGWLDETLGDSELSTYYHSQYGMSKHIGSYGEGYLINWARQNLGANGVAARSALVELPPVYSQAQADAQGFSTKYYNATLNMLRGIQ